MLFTTLNKKDMDTNTIMREHATMKEILADSFGGVMYNVANQDKYDTTELLALWDNLSDNEQSSCDGCVTGAIRFVQGN